MLKNIEYRFVGRVKKHTMLNVFWGSNGTLDVELQGGARKDSPKH
jgi:hypothetical protein